MTGVPPTKKNENKLEGGGGRAGGNPNLFLERTSGLNKACLRKKVEKKEEEPEKRNLMSSGGSMPRKREGVKQQRIRIKEAPRATAKSGVSKKGEDVLCESVP